MPLLPLHYNINHHSTLSPTTTIHSIPCTSAEPNETSRWEEDWVLCARELGQWNVLKEYGQSRDDPNTLLDACWKLPDWTSVKTAFNMPAVVALAECQLPDTKLMLYQIYAAINEGRTADVEKLCRQANQLVLQKWQSLPKVVTNAHTRSLQMFQNVVELEESVKIMQEITSASRRDAFPAANFNFEQMMHAWRERTPNEWDGVSVWSDVLKWRSHMYQFVQKTFTNVPKANLSRLHDTHWTTLKLASVIQSYGNVDLASDIVKSLTLNEKGMKKDKTFTMVPAYVFQKVRDELSATLLSSLSANHHVVLNSTSPISAVVGAVSSINSSGISQSQPQEQASLYHEAISKINGIDFAKFEPWQRAELYVMKAKVLERMGTAHLHDAMHTFSLAMTIAPDQGQCWIEWAQFYDRQLYKSTKGSVIPSQKHAHALGARQLEGMTLEYAVSAMSTYLHAVHCSHDPSTRLCLARVIRLLQCNDPSERMIQVFANHVEQTPMWAWITWVPQLLHSLSRPEAMQSFSILYGLSNMFPQAVYHHLRCYLLEQRDKKAMRARTQQQAMAKNSAAQEQQQKESGKKSAKADSSSSSSSSTAAAALAARPPMEPYRAEAEQFGVRTQSQVEEAAQLRQPQDTLDVATKYMSNTGHLMQIKAGTSYQEMLHLPNGGDPIKPAYEYAEELMAFLRTTHQSLVSEIELLLTELITSFKPGPEEELLSAVLVLQEKCFQTVETGVDFQHCAVPPKFQATLQRVGERYFHNEKSSSSSSASSTTQSRTKPEVAAFYHAFRDKYFDDFVLERTPKRTLLYVANSLERWKRMLQSRLNRSHHHHQSRQKHTSKQGKNGNHHNITTTTLNTTSSMTLRRERHMRNTHHMDPCLGGSRPLSIRHKSKALASFTSDSVEIPGQYSYDNEPSPMQHTTLNSIDPYYEIVYRPGLSRAQSRVTMVGDDGSMSSFLIQYCVPILTPTDERAMQLFQLTNRLLKLHRTSRSRNLQIHSPLIVPVAPRVRLSKEDTTFVSFAQLYERDCDRRQQSCLTPAIKMHGISAVEQLSASSSFSSSSLLPSSSSVGSMGSVNIGASDIERRRRRLHEYEKICNTMTNPAVLTEFLTDKMVDPASKWSVTKQLTQQWAITSILSYIFYIEQRDPSKFVFAADTGNLLSLHFRPAYHRGTGQLIGFDHVPFRLTPALQHLMTPIGIHGTLAESMMSTAACLHSKLSFIEDYATLFFGSDMLPWHRNHQMAVVKMNAQNNNGSSGSSSSNEDKVEVVNLAAVVDRNVDQVLQRIREIAPLDSAPEHDRTTCLSTSVPSSTPACINQAVHELIKIASNPANLCMQEPLWAPYF